MKRNTLFLLPVCFLLFTSCNNTGPQRQPLGKPVITVNAQKNGITWDAVEDAVSYKVTVNSEAPQTVTTPGYAFSTVEGNYTVSVVAVADDEKYNSEASSYAYSTGATSVGELTLNKPVITWASLVGMGLEVKLGDNGVYADVTGTSYTATASGTYFFHAKGGFDETNKKFYVDGTNSTRSIEVDLRDPLAAPVLKLNADKNGLEWDAIEGAVGYAVSVDGGEAETVTTPSYAFARTEGQHTISVIAKADAAKYDSQAATYSYETKFAILGDLTNSGAAITWSRAVGMGIEYAIDNGEYVAVEGESIAISTTGVYQVRSKVGFDETGKIFYTTPADGAAGNAKAIVVTKAATSALVIEDGSEASNADLKDKYYIEKYGDSGWAESVESNVTLSQVNKGYSEGNAVRAKYFKHGAAFRYNTNIAPTGSYNTVVATVKGENAPQSASFTITFRVTKATMLGSVNLQNVYMYYKVNTLPQRWTTFAVSFADAGWKIGFGGQELSFAQVQSALASSYNTKVESLGELIQYFDKACFSFNCATDANWSATYAYIDDFKLINVETPETSTQAFPMVMENHYAFESVSLSGRLDKSGNDWTLSFPFGGNFAQFPVTIETEGDEATVECKVTGYDFKAVVTSTDDGKTLSYKSATGTVAPLLSGLKAEAYYVLDDFESYAGTGQGYDNNHKNPDQRSGLRGAYYSDYYAGGTASDEIGGSGWSLMGSNDYLDLNTTAANVHGGTKSARMKYNSGNQMRFSTYALSDGSGFPYAKASYLSFWTKGVSDRDNKFKVKVYYRAQVEAATQDTDVTVAEVTVPKNADWTEVIVPLKTNVFYYGFSILPLKNGGTSGTYFYVDDICLYGSLSPWLHLRSNYAFETTGGTKGTLAVANNGTGTLKMGASALPVSLQVQNNGKVKMVSTTTNYDFEATLTSSDKYVTLKIEGDATGTIGAMLAGFKAAVYQVIDDFESYSATGVGYDQSHAAANKSGLRGAFYADYYSGGSGSPLGGSGWSLMGSNDYIELNTTETNVHGGAKSARFKYNASNQMRYFTWGLYDGSAKAYDTASTFSMFVQGVSTRANVLKIRVYFVQQVSNAKGNIESGCTELSVTVPQGSDWTEVKVTLAAGKIYYGYSILPIKGNGSGQYFFVDDVAIYNSVSPYAA